MAARGVVALGYALLLAATAAAGPEDSTTTTTAVPDTTTTSDTTSSTTTTVVPATSTTTATLAPGTTTSSTTTPTTATATSATTVATTSSTMSTTTLPAPAGCVPDDPHACDDGDPCTRDGCDPITLACVHAAALDGTPCPDDGVACTEDVCASGTCTHRPRDLVCDRGGCAVRACRPGDPGADRDGCVLVKSQSRRDGASCTDDGFSCTEDVCMGGLCLHMPVDSACAPSDSCRMAQCAPSRDGHDDAGCVPGEATSDGEPCAEDADACTTDVCRGGTCEHERDVDTTACAPVEDAFHRTIALGNLTEEIGAGVASVDAPAAATVLDRLAPVQADLDAAERALAGDAGPAPAVAGTGTGTTSPPAAVDRARIAFTMVLRTPREVTGFLQTLAEARTRAALGQTATHQLRRRGRVLLRGTRHLRATLRVLAR